MAELLAPRRRVGDRGAELLTRTAAGDHDKHPPPPRASSSPSADATPSPERVSKRLKKRAADEKGSFSDDTAEKRDDGAGDATRAELFPADATTTTTTTRERGSGKRGDDAVSADCAPWVATWLDNVRASGGPTNARDSMKTLGTKAITDPPDGSEFTTNWFSHVTPTLTRVFDHLGWIPDFADADASDDEKNAPDASSLRNRRRRSSAASAPRHVLEIGAWEGRGTQWLLMTLCRNRGSTLTAVDTWEGGEQYAGVGLDLDDAAHAGDVVEARSILHWSPYDRVRVVNADP